MSCFIFKIFSKRTFNLKMFKEFLLFQLISQIFEIEKNGGNFCYLHSSNYLYRAEFFCGEWSLVSEEHYSKYSIFIEIKFVGNLFIRGKLGSFERSESALATAANNADFLENNFRFLLHRFSLKYPSKNKLDFSYKNKFFELDFDFYFGHRAHVFGFCENDLLEKIELSFLNGYVYWPNPEESKAFAYACSPEVKDFLLSEFEKFEAKDDSSVFEVKKKKEKKLVIV